MNHQEIERDEIVERYAQHRLPSEERLAFQEHYFACDECFDKVQTTAQFIAGVQDASRRGVLSPARHESGSSLRFSWFRPAFAISLATCALLIATLVWLVLWKFPSYQSEIARERQARQDSERKLTEAHNQTEEIERQLDAERTRLNEQAQPDKPKERPGTELIAQANIPTVTLEATRNSDSASLLTISPATKYAVLRIPVEPGNRVYSYRVLVQTREGRTIETFNKLRPNRTSTLSVTLPTKNLSANQYLVRIYGAVGTQTELLGEYDLRVVVQQ